MPETRRRRIPMKTALQSPDFNTIRGRTKKKPRTVRTPPQKSKGSVYVYPDLNEFLMQYPVATVNEYGAKVISGRRIC